MGVAGDFYMIYVGLEIKGWFAVILALFDTHPVWLLATKSMI